jgi:hypothetical protein
MIRFPLLALVVTMVTPAFALDVVHDAGTCAMNETTTRQESVPVAIASPAQPLTSAGCETGKAFELTILLDRTFCSRSTHGVNWFTAFRARRS